MIINTYCKTTHLKLIYYLGAVIISSDSYQLYCAGDLMGKKRKLMGFSWEVKIFGHDAFIGEIEGNCECLEKYWI